MSDYHDIRHARSCDAGNRVDNRYLCTCGLAALEAKAAKWDAAIEQGSVIVKATDYLTMQADAAKWRALRLDLSITTGGAVDDILADAARFRKIEAAVEKHEGTLMFFKELSSHPAQRYVIGTMGRFSSGHYEMEAREASLAAAVGALPEWKP